MAAAPACTPLSCLRALVVAQRGVAAVEFAIVAPMFIAMLLMCLQTALVLFTQAVMQTAVEQAARRLAVGEPQRAGESAEQFKQRTCAQMPRYFACSGLVLDIRHAPTLSMLPTAAPRRADFGDGRYTGPQGYSPGGPDDYVLVRMVYVWSVQTSPFGADLSDLGPGRRLMMATMVIKVEPYKP